MRFEALDTKNKHFSSSRKHKTQLQMNCLFVNSKRPEKYNYNIFIILLIFKKNILFKCNISEGLTGTLHFDRAGNRKKFNLEIYEIKRSKPLSKVATYSSLSGFKTNRPIDTQQVSGKRRKNHLIVISIKVNNCNFNQ